MTGQPITSMTLKRLRQIVDAHGADSSRWPEAERASAEAFAAQSAEARDLLAQARMLDGALDDLPSDVPDAAMARLVAATAFPPLQTKAARSSAPNGWLSGLGSLLWPRTAALVTMAVLGIVVGLASEPVYSNNDDGLYATSELSADLIEDYVP